MKPRVMKRARRVGGSFLKGEGGGGAMVFMANSIGRGRAQYRGGEGEDVGKMWFVLLKNRGVEKFGGVAPKLGWLG